MNYGEYCENFLEKFTKQNTARFRRAKQIKVIEDTGYCPYCGCKLEVDYTHSETYCPSCGVITAASINYVGLRRVKYPYE